MLEWLALGEIKFSIVEVFTQKTPPWEDLEEILGLDRRRDQLVKRARRTGLYPIHLAQHWI